MKNLEADQMSIRITFKSKHGPSNIISESPILLPIQKTNPDSLNTLLNHLQSNKDSSHNLKTRYLFYCQGELIIDALNKVSTEDSHCIEYDEMPDEPESLPIILQDDWIKCTALHKGLLAVGSYDTKVRIYTPSNEFVAPKCEFEFSCEAVICALEWSVDGSGALWLVVGCAKGNIYSLSWAKKKWTTHKLGIEIQCIVSYNNSADGSNLILIGDRNGTLFFYNLFALKPHKTLKLCSSPLTNIHIHKQSKSILCTLQSGLVQCIDIDSKLKYFSFKCPPLTCSALLQRDGLFLITCHGNGSVCKWIVCLEEGKENCKRLIRVPNAHSGWITSTCVSPDESMIITSGHDGLAKMWNSTLNPLFCFEDDVDRMHANASIGKTRRSKILSTCLDSTLLVYAGESKQIHIRRISSTHDSKTT